MIRDLFAHDVYTFFNYPTIYFLGPFVYFGSVTLFMIFSLSYRYTGHCPKCFTDYPQVLTLIPVLRFTIVPGVFTNLMSSTRVQMLLIDYHLLCQIHHFLFRSL